jgi:hypothetical protein
MVGEGWAAEEEAVADRVVEGRGAAMGWVAAGCVQPAAAQGFRDWQN